MTLPEMLVRYRELTTAALALASAAPRPHKTIADDILDMASRYVSDAEHFAASGDELRALAALAYAHGWLDCGARLGCYTVTDDRLFTIDPAETPLLERK